MNFIKQLFYKELGSEGNFPLGQLSYIRKIFPEENCPRLGLGFGLGSVLELGSGGQFSSGAIVLEPKNILTKYFVIAKFKSSFWRCSIKEAALKNFAKFTAKQFGIFY